MPKTKCTCWCCFCFCCIERCSCCKDFDDVDVGARGCCRDYQGEPMPFVRGFIKVGNCIKRVFNSDPCGCSIKIHTDFIRIEWRNTITYKQGLIAMSLFNLSVMLVAGGILGVLQSKAFYEWNQEIKRRKFVVGDEWRSKYYLTPAPIFQEDRFQRIYCCTALSFAVVGAAIIGEICLLFALCCRSMCFCGACIFFSTLGPVSGLIYQPIQYIAQEARYDHDPIYNYYYLAFWIPETLFHIYKLWVLGYFMNQLRFGRYGLPPRDPPNPDPQNLRDNINEVYRDVATNVVRSHHLDTRDTFYPDEANSSYALAQEYLISHANRTQTLHKPTLAELREGFRK